LNDVLNGHGAGHDVLQVPRRWFWAGSAGSDGPLPGSARPARADRGEGPAFTDRAVSRTQRDRRWLNGCGRSRFAAAPPHGGAGPLTCEPVRSSAILTAAEHLRGATMPNDGDDLSALDGARDLVHAEQRFR